MMTEKHPHINSTEKIHQMIPEVIYDLQWALSENNFDEFKGLKIDRREPHTLRLFYFKDDLRICLHIFQACEWEDAFPHPHNWYSQVFIVKGCYRHWVSEHTPLDKRPDINKGFVHVLGTGSSYSINNPYLWHKVQPLMETMTLMINEKDWEEKSDFSVTTKGKELVELSNEEKQEMIERFVEQLQHFV